jgi:hypothetical protein
MIFIGLDFGGFVQKPSHRDRFGASVSESDDSNTLAAAALISGTMTELEIPPEADEERATKLVQEHVSIGDVVEVRSAEQANSDLDRDLEGTVTGVEHGYLEIDDKPVDEGSIRYDEIHTITIIDAE